MGVHPRRLRAAGVLTSSTNTLSCAAPTATQRLFHILPSPSSSSSSSSNSMRRIPGSRGLFRARRSSYYYRWLIIIILASIIIISLHNITPTAQALSFWPSSSSSSSSGETGTSSTTTSSTNHGGGEHQAGRDFFDQEDIENQASDEEEEDDDHNKDNNIIQMAGYLPDYRALDVKNLNLNETVTQLDDLILFSLEVHSRGMVGGCCLSHDHYQAAKIAKEYHNPNLRLWVTVGGQGRTNGKREVCGDPQKRYKFMQSMIRLCKREGIQGIDLDWLSDTQTPQEKVHFLEFLKEATKVWHHNGLLVSVPLHVRQVLPVWVYDAVDRIHLMVYDSPPMPPETVRQYGNHNMRVVHADHALKVLIESGCPSSKIWLGVPFYGTQRAPPFHVQTYKEVLDVVLTTTERSLFIAYPSKNNNNNNNNNDKKNNHDDATSVIAGDQQEQEQQQQQQQPDNSGGVSFMKELEAAFEGYQYDAPSVIREKMGYVHKRKLGGVFIWELGQDLQTERDPAGIMLTAMRDSARSRQWNYDVLLPVIPPEAADDDDSGAADDSATTTTGNTGPKRNEL